MRRVLVTGAGGFMGGHLVEALLERGFDVRAFVRYGTGRGLTTLGASRPEDVVGSPYCVRDYVVDGHFEAWAMLQGMARLR